MKKLPSWFKQKVPSPEAFFYSKKIKEKKINTVCESAKCPNWTSCFHNKSFTFMILGNQCTRHCQFCAINKKREHLELDLDEPNRLVELVKELDLEYITITSVTRDDLPDKGASIFAETVRVLKKEIKKIKIELLIPDFCGDLESLKIVLQEKPDVVAHNLETVNRLYSELRPQANYKRSLGVIRKIKEIDSSIVTKSSLMLGLGEREEEVFNTLKDLKNTHCDIVCLGQYLSPSDKAYPVKEFITLEKFEKYKDFSKKLGFAFVSSGPLVRSSYNAKLLYEKVKKCMN